MKSVESMRKTSLSLAISAILGGYVVIHAPRVSAEDQGKTETIVVVGENIDKSLKETTSGVSVFTEDQYENGETQNLNDLATVAPNVTTSGFGAISIRGIDGTGAATGGYALYSGARARVTTVIDGIAQSWSGYGYTPSKLWDSKQVEVLKGPQSTNLGTNAIGGALVVSTNDPSYQREAAVRVGLESYKNGNMKNHMAVMANAPIIEDELAFRLAIDGTKGEGWMNYDTSEVDLDDGVDIDDSENINGRFKLLWEPAAIPGLSAKLTANVHDYEGEFLNWANDENYTDQTLTLGARSNVRLQDSTIRSLAADIDYELTAGITNSFHISYLISDVEFQQYPTAMTVTSDKDNFTVENRLTFQQPDARLSGVLGLYYSDEDTDLYVSSRFEGPDNTTTSAVFGEMTYALTDSVRLVGGARYEHEQVDRSMDFASSSVSDFDQDTSESIFLPKVGLSVDLTDNTTWSASVRQGYNPGSAMVTLDTYEYYTYDKETVWAYETGLRSEWDNAEASVNVFYNDYTDYQAMVSESEGSLYYVIDNIDSAHTYGIELAGSVWAMDSLQLRGSLGLMDSEIDSDDAAEDGAELPNAPKTNASLGFTQYLGEHFSFGSDVTYVGKYYSDLDNTDDYKAGDYTTVNARLQYEYGDFTIDGYVTNLTNEDIVYYNNAGTRASVGQTRTVGLNLTYRM